MVGNSGGGEAGRGLVPVALDLFGDPIPAGRGRAGRPEHVPSAENRAFVTMLLAVGREPKEVAAALGISMPTMRKHYFSELGQRKSARLRVEGHMLVALAREATAGNVGAAKRVLDRLDRAALGPPAQVKPAKAEPVGKKESQRNAAYEAHKGTGWADLTSPRSVN